MPRDHNSINVLIKGGPMRIVMDFVLLLALPLNVGDFFLLCCFLLAELDCQSKLFFSSVAVFPFCNRRGALSQVHSKETCFAADYSSEMEQKTGRNVCSQKKRKRRRGDSKASWFYGPVSSPMTFFKKLTAQ